MWSNIISKLNVLLENELIDGAERILVKDFLDFVTAFFPELNPYDSLSVCKDNSDLLNRRCVDLMRQAEIGKVIYHRGRHHMIRIENKPGVKQIGLWAEGGKPDG